MFHCLAVTGILSQTADLQIFNEIFVWCVWCFSKQTKKSSFMIKNQPLAVWSFITSAGHKEILMRLP